MPQPNEYIFSNDMKIGHRPKVTATKGGALLQGKSDETEYFIESPLCNKASRPDWHATSNFLVEQYFASRSLIQQLEAANTELRTSMFHNARQLHDIQNANGKLHFTLNQTTLRWPYKFLPRWLRGQHSVGAEPHLMANSIPAYLVFMLGHVSQGPVRSPIMFQSFAAAQQFADFWRPLCLEVWVEKQDLVESE